MSFLEFYSSKVGIFAGCTVAYLVLTLALIICHRRKLRFRDIYEDFLMALMQRTAERHGETLEDVMTDALDFCGIDDETPAGLAAEAERLGRK